MPTHHHSDVAGFKATMEQRARPWAADDALGAVQHLCSKVNGIWGPNWFSFKNYHKMDTPSRPPRKIDTPTHSRMSHNTHNTQNTHNSTTVSKVG
jgi:hypothetical protein